LALLLALGQTPVLAATINVGGACTLVNAITAANNNLATGGCTAGAGVDTIVLPEGSRQTLTEINNSTFGRTGLPVVASTITIDGAGSTIMRSGVASDFRILAVNSAGNLTLRQTTVSGGVATQNASGNVEGDDNGGGTYVYGGVLRLINSTISGNAARFDGGGVSISYGTLTILNSIIAGNSAGGVGGGISSSSGALTVTDSTISGNSAFGGGGASTIDSAVNLTNSTVSGNSAAGHAGGVYNSFSSVDLSNSTIRGILRPAMRRHGELHQHRHPDQ
jgi:hypothetical protein